MTIANTDMAAAWDGADGDDWSRDWKRYDRSLAGFHAKLLEAAAITATDRVLDIGCGNGQTTLDAARAATSGSAVGVDLSSKMLARARERAAADGVANATFEQADAQVHPFEPASADIAISRFGSMFFADPVAAFTNIAGAIAPGGRLALVVWQPGPKQGWLAAVRGALALGRDVPAPLPGAPGPFALGDADRTRSILESSGFGDVQVDAVEGEFWMGDDADDAYGFASTMGIARGMLDGVSDADRVTGFANLRAAIESADGSRGVQFDSAAWLVTARRP